MGLVDNFKDLFKLADAANNVELYKQLSELQTRAMELEEQNGQLRTENQDLKQTLNLRQKMQFKEPFYYQEGDEVPFCPSCMECKDSAVHVVFEANNSTAMYWHCPVCKTQYRVVKDRSEQKPPRVNFKTSQWG
jgi:hypothetical protein